MMNFGGCVLVLILVERDHKVNGSIQFVYPRCLGCREPTNS